MACESLNDGNTRFCMASACVVFMSSILFYERVYSQVIKIIEEIVTITHESYLCS